MKKFTVITDVFYKLDIFKHTADAILNQTYKNLEIIIIDNHLIIIYPLNLKW